MKLNCILCMNIYISPKRLPCKHSFCERCLNRHIQENVKMGGYDLEEYAEGKQPDLEPSETFFVCPSPECNTQVSPPEPKRPTWKWAQQFSNNIVVAALVDKLREKSVDKSCDFCLEEAIVIKAVFVCLSCSQALCGNCTEIHRSFCPTHELHSWLEMVSDESLQSNTKSSKKGQCPHHIGKVLDHYCGDCNKIFCSECVNVHHNHCSNVRLLEDAWQTMMDDCGDSALQGKLDESFEKVNDTIERKMKHQDILDVKKSQIQAQIDSMKEHMTRSMARMEASVHDVFDKFHSKEKETAETHIRRCEFLRKSILESRDRLNRLQEEGVKPELLVELRNMEFERAKFMTEVESTSMKKTVTVSFDFEKQLQYVFDTVDSMGILTFTFNEDGNDEKSVNLPGSFQNRISLAIRDKLKKEEKNQPQVDEGISSPRALSPGCLDNIEDDQVSIEKKSPVQRSLEINVKLSTDTHCCWLTDCAFLGNGDILVADRENKKLKHFSPAGEFQAELCFRSKPWALSVRKGTQVAVTLPEMKEIQLLTVGHSLLPNSTIVTKDMCYGVDFVGERIAVTCISDTKVASVILLSTTGTMLCKFEIDTITNCRLFCLPRYIKYIQSGDVQHHLVVTDAKRSCVTWLSLETGEAEKVVSRANLNYPGSMAVDRSGDVYVCGCATRNVILLSQTDDGKTVLSNHAGLPRSIAIHPQGKQLLLTLDSGRLKDFVQVYNINIGSNSGNDWAANPAVDNTNTTKKPSLCRCVYSYDAQDTDELSFDQGDVIEILEEVEGGWSTGRIKTGTAKGQEGFFPTNYTEKFEADSEHTLIL